MYERDCHGKKIDMRPNGENGVDLGIFLELFFSFFFVVVIGFSGEEEERREVVKRSG